MELRDRPDDWSEKKAQLGLVGDRVNSNHEPLGKRRADRKRSFQPSPSSQSSQSSQSPLMFDPEEWKDWEPPSKNKVVRDLLENFTLGIADCRDLVETFKGRKGDEEHENVLFYLKTYEDLLSLHVHDESIAEVERDFAIKASSWSKQLQTLKETLEEKTEGEDRAVKEVTKLMAELEDEVKCYYSARSTKKYQNIQNRMKIVTNKMAQLRPSSSHNVKLMEDIKVRLAKLWTDFEDRSEPVVDILTKNMEVEADSKTNVKAAAIKRYEKEMIEVVAVFLRTFREKFPDAKALNSCAANIVKTKILSQEILQYSKIVEKKGKSWADFYVTDASKKNVRKYLEVKFSRQK